MLPIENINSLSESWLSQVLTIYNDTDCKTLSLKINTSDKKEGFLSDIVYLTTKIKIANEVKEEHLVVKFMPNTKEETKFVLNGKLAEREVEFYKFSQSETFKKVVDKCGLTLVVPEVIYSDLIDSNLTIVMKDLKLLNYKTVMDRDGSSLEHTLRIFSSIAVIHASGLYNFKKSGSHDLKKYEDNSFYDQFLGPNIEKLSELFKESVLSTIFQKLVPLCNSIRKSPINNPLFETVIHGDLWAGQCMFSEDEKEVCILDWQFSTVGNPVMDLMAMFFMSSDPSVLENHLDKTLNHYWKELTNNLDKININHPVSFSDFIDCVERHWMTGFLFIAVSLHDFLGEDNISESRLKGLMNFLHKRNVFSQFIEEFESPEK